MGPFVGTFNVPIELGPEVTRVVLHALNALGNLGSYQVTVNDAMICLGSQYHAHIQSYKGDPGPPRGPNRL